MADHHVALVALVSTLFGAIAFILAIIVGALVKLLLVAREILLFLATLSLAAAACTLCMCMWNSGWSFGRSAKTGLELDGWRRILAFINKVVPIVLHYKFVQLKMRGTDTAKREAAFLPLHARYAPKALAICQQMQGFYIKLGQMCAAAGCGVVPETYAHAFQVLLEDCPSVPFEVIQDIVERGVGSLVDIFESFDELPLHTASIGQVHGASLHGGLDVVVKVQLPDAEQNFRIDMECFLEAARLLFPEHVHELEELRRSFATEFDYTKEAQLQREAAMHLKEFSGVVVPLPIDQFHPKGNLAGKVCGPERSGLCTRKVLVMERLHGKSLARWGIQMADIMATEQGCSREEVLSALRHMTPEELEGQRAGALALWMYAASAYKSAALAYRLSAPLRASFDTFYYSNTLASSLVDWVAEFMPAQFTLAALPPTDLFAMPETLFQVQGYMIFEVGFVNTDPHPGNLMLLEDGRLGLIDWGQVKRFSPDQRCRLARAVIAVADGDEVQAATCMRSMGMRTTRDLDWTYSRQAYFYFSSWADDHVRELGGPLRVEESLNKVDKILDGVGEFMMAIRNQFFTRQALAMLGFPKISSATFLRPAAVRCLEGLGKPVPRSQRREVACPPNLQRLLGLQDKPA